ncbi:MAG: urea ABC transporter permease subunit UrtB [Woeseiaceae bacterium]
MNIFYKQIKQAILIVASLMLLTTSFEVAAEEDAFTSAVSKLSAKKFKEKELAVDGLMKITDERILSTLQALLKGKLYYKKSNKQIVYLKKHDDEYVATSVITNEKLAETNKRKFKKIRVNNKLRGKLRGYIAQLSLENKNPKIRLSAMKEMMSSVTEESLLDIQQRLKNEKNSDVLEIIQIFEALVAIDKSDKSVRLSAIKTLGASLEPNARIKIVSLLEKDESDNYIESDSDIVYAALKAKKIIDERRDVFAFFEKVFFGLSLGSVLLLAAIGLAITFGVMGVINMAHGELIMIGAYTTYVVQLLMPNHIGLSLLVAVPAAFIVSGLFGIAIERTVIRHLYGRPLETLLATFGISLVLQQLVRSVFSPLNRSVETPEWMSGALEINPVFFITYNRLTIVFFSLFVFAALLLILKKTSLGLKVRAVSQNRTMARAMGIRSEWVDALTFGLGSGIAGIAGVALSQLTNVGPNLGQAYIIDSFLVVVFGGVGNLWGTLVGAMSLGLFNKFIEPVTGAVLAKIFVLVFIILFIQKKPRGLFPQKGRSAEN